jgi:hypothetical protein
LSHFPQASSMVSFAHPTQQHKLYFPGLCEDRWFGFQLRELNCMSCMLLS